MAGFFTLTLDTTGPQIDIYAPPYSNRSSNNEIRIVSNELLADYQEVYVVDSQGVRHDIILSFDGNQELSGNIQFTDYPMGIATIYAMVRDDVSNNSNLASRAINIISSHDSLMLRLTLLELKSNVELSESISKVDLLDKELMKVSVRDSSSRIIINDSK
jgi:hypothetical protein